MFWSSSILEAWIFPIWRFTAAFPAEQAWHFWVHHRFWQIVGESSLPLALCRALEGCGMAPGLPTTSCCFSCLQQPAANTNLQSCSKHLQQETEESLQLGFAALPKTYKLLDFLIAISGLLSEEEGAAYHSCCYLVYVIPLCTQVGIYNTALLVWIFFWF